jgi:hypothetical protein
MHFRLNRLEQRVKLVRLALGQNFDTAIGQVSDRSGDIEASSQ